VKDGKFIAEFEEELFNKWGAFLNCKEIVDKGHWIKEHIEEDEDMDLKENEYQCTRCGNIYEKTWTDEEAMEETKDNFGKEIVNKPMDVICEDCYNIIMKQ